MVLFMIYKFIFLAIFAGDGNLQDVVAGPQQPLEQTQVDSAPINPPKEVDIFDEFDIDAPFDERMDIGVDWPTQLETDSETNDRRRSDDNAPLNDIIRQDNNLSSQSADASQNDIQHVENSDNLTIADENAIADVIAETLTDEGRQEALKFDNDIPIIAEQNQNDIDIVNLGSEQRYSIVFSGLEDIDAGRVIARFNALSALLTNSGESANGSQILRRSKTDVDLLERLLRLEGYYDNLVEYSFQNNQPNELSNADIKVILTISLGPQYRFSSINLPGIEASDEADFLRDALSLTRGDAVEQDAIVDGRIRLQNRLLENGYAFGNVGEADLLIDHARREGDLTIAVTPERKYRFGRILTSPDAPFSGKHLENIARFEQGDIFKQSNIADLRQAIFGTSLASNIVITPVPSASNPDQVDLNVKLGPAPPRTVAGQLGFNTGEGFRSEASWEHRNFFPPEGAINVAAILGTREQALGLTFRRNNFQGRDRVLTATFAARNQNLNAFNARSINFGIGYERRTTLIFQKKWTWNAGIEYALSDEEAVFDIVESRELFNILALPAGITYDGSDDLLDPRKGFRLSARVAPEFSVGVADIAYFKSQIDGSAYQPIHENLTLAGRIRLGSITGAQTQSIAPSRRNFAGGGSSVRGFGFQDIGPLDINGNPTGGRGLAELALEARYRIGVFGIVPFVDAGSITNNAYPDFSDLRFAAGLGLRYYTSFGPVRFDVGTPLNRREGESLLAVAISLGQAF